MLVHLVYFSVFSDIKKECLLVEIQIIDISENHFSFLYIESINREFDIRTKIDKDIDLITENKIFGIKHTNLSFVHQKFNLKYQKFELSIKN